MRQSIVQLIILIMLAGCKMESSGLKLPSLIGDNMLLQQKTNVRIWGKATPGHRINVSASWNAYSQTIADKDGKWATKIPTPEAGGPFSITITAKDSSVTINNVMVGEVWFCSGQSNMEMPVAGWPPNDTVMYSASTIASASIPEIRLFNVQRKVSGEPLDDCSGQWEICTPSTVNQFSATAYFFGKKLYDELHVPVGLIESAWGGTPAESWMSSVVLEKAGEFVPEIRGIKESVPVLAEYQSWLNEHKQVELGPDGEGQWKDLRFNDENVPLPDFDDSKWPLMSLPKLFEGTIGDFDGAVWFRKTVEVPEAMTGKDLVLSLGPIDDMDRTYFNGKLIGSNESSGVWQVDRNYNVPKDFVKSGPNIIAVRVIDNQGGGGIWGKPGSIMISVKGAGSSRIDLDGEWKCQPVAELIGNKFYIFDLTSNEFSGKERPKTLGPYSPTTLYNAMVNPVKSYPIRGAIWYQGEANVGRAEQYSKIFPLMILNWRDSWGIKDFPFYFVQIAPYEYSGIDSTESAFLREAQESALELPKTGMAVTLDIATVMNIHPPFKKEVGERLANLALANDYGKNLKTQGPLFKSVAVDGKTIKVQFDNIEDGLVAKGGKLSDFEIAGQDGKFTKADAKIVNNEVWVTSPKIADPVSVRYCWRNGSEASLFNSAGLPALQFRTKKTD
jgi:sialate O-acetylesterase